MPSIPKSMILSLALGAALIVSAARAADAGPAPLGLENDRLKLGWERKEDGWQLRTLQAKKGSEWVSMSNPSGLYTVLYLNRPPAEALVKVDREGTAYPFFPKEAERRADGSIIFREQLDIGEVTAVWSLDPRFPSDVRVALSIKARKGGSFSLATPTLAVWEREDIRWGMVPGNWYGTGVQENFELSPGYSQGIPARAVLVNEQNTMTLSPMMTGGNGLTLAVIPEPGTSADPWALDQDTHNQARLGISTMDRYSRHTPVIYAPKLGAPGSKVPEGTELKLNFRYTLQAGPWFDIFNHAATEIYQFQNILELQSSRESLSDRVARLQTMLKDDVKSAWRKTKVNGFEIGSNGAKTSDIGAMWMMARTSEDPVLLGRLPFLRSYKLAQQQTAPGFFQYAATGEYPEAHGFAAERGNWIEPLFTTYYTLQDMGNIALFDPADREIRERIRLAADKLISWQHADGSWDVAYDNVSNKSSFPFLRDLRPTWYGLLIAWRTLQDERYLAAARKGADWYLENAVGPAHFLGACGDALNIWDFTTGFGARALLDLHDSTKDPKYLAAAIRVAEIYATTVFTHPMATTQDKKVGSLPRKDWEISQVGLSVEHIRGTAQSGPITLSSHAGLFVRMTELTGRPIFRDMARAAARGRHHFVNETTGLSVYYWNGIANVEKASTLFPWHAEWQVGWITDYLLSEARLRSEGRIVFPAGYATPKVGPQVTYGFAPGRIYDRPASLWLSGGAVSCDNANAEYVSALSPDQRTLYLVVQNQYAREQTVTVRVDAARPAKVPSLRWNKWEVLAGEISSADGKAGTVTFKLPAWGQGVVALSLGSP